MQSRWSGILIGTVVTFASMAGLTFLGVGLGLLGLPMEADSEAFLGVGIGAAVYLAIATFAAYYAGGCIASRLHEPRVKGEACFQGLGVMGLTFTLLTAVAATSVSAGLGRLGTIAGGLGAMEVMRRADPKLETDVDLSHTALRSEMNANAQAPKVKLTVQQKEELKQAADTARKAAAAASLGAFFLLLIAMIGSAVGAWYGRPTPASAVNYPILRRTTQAA